MSNGWIPFEGRARRIARAASAIRPVASPAGVARSLGRVARSTAQPVLPSPSLRSAVGGRVVLLTGASSGIGRAAALRLGAAGATLLVVARRERELADVVREIEGAGGSARAYPTDLSDGAAIDRLVERVHGDGLEVDVLVNDAGRSIRRSLAQSYGRFHDFERTMQLNFFAPVRLTLALLPGMRARRRGHVVNVSTLGVQIGTPRFAAYLASKAALDEFARVAATECLSDGVRFTTVHMPLVRTPMISPTRLYDRLPALSPEQAAELVTDALRTGAEQVGPRVGRFAEVGYAVSPAATNEVLHALYRAVPEEPPPARPPG
jgi:NAD(P)-dependent dehydrogenase (short-subunit alcohol dehydrogenase family)